MKRNQLLVFSLATIVLACVAQVSHAQRVRWSLGIGIGGPVYPRPYYGYAYRWAPYYYYPSPVLVEPAPIIVQTPPVTVVPSPSVQTPSTPAPAVVPVQDFTSRALPLDQLLRQLADSSDVVRRDAAMELGRMKAAQAVDPLMTLLSKDASPTVRDAAARALGLIASPRSLNVLIYAAQADADRDVRHSAQFAVEIIRANLRRN